MNFETLVARGGRDVASASRPLTAPIYQTNVYVFEDMDTVESVWEHKTPGFVYGRQGNPTAAALEAKITKMEDGIATACFSTGMAAIAATFVALLRAGDHVVSSSYLFGNTNSLFGTFNTQGFDISFVDATRVDEVERALRPNTRLVFVETIANPRTQVADLARIGELCARRGLLLSLIHI